MKSRWDKGLIWAIALGAASAAGCADVGGGESGERAEIGTAEEDAITAPELSTLVLGSPHPVTNGYQPNGIHAGIDFGSTGDGVTDVKSPVNGTIIANTSACGKVAIYDGSNTVIMAHMTSRTVLTPGSAVSVGTYLGKASKVIGGGCSATAAHLHLEIRTGYNTSMALPSANNTSTTLNPLSYTYGAFPPVSLGSPADGTYVASNPVWFTWSPIQGAGVYRLQISAANSFDANSCVAGCAYNQTTGGTSQSVSLTPGKVYYWRVRAGNSSTGQGGNWSPVRSVQR